MVLINFHVVQGPDEFNGAVGIRCEDGKTPVLALVEREALDDYFGWPWTLADKRSPTIEERRLVVDRHLKEFEELAQAMYGRGDYQSLDRYGATLPVITIDQLSKAEITLTDSVIQMSRNSRFGN